MTQAMYNNSRCGIVRPCEDHEVAGIVETVLADGAFDGVARYVYGDVEEAARRLRACRTVRNFQCGVMEDAVKRILERTTSGFQAGGLESLDSDSRHVFIANHRDIVLDAYLLQHALIKKGLNTTRVAIGANLMCHPLMVALARLNKMFTIERGGSLRAFYESLRGVSEYIRHSVVEDSEGVWIAQRNGRTKDGVDRTDPALLKMLAMAHGGDEVEAMDELRIVPVSISYEYEPCDGFKAKELVVKAREGVYEKAEGEDMRSVLAGINSQKGSVRLNVCAALTREELEDARGEDPMHFFTRVAALIDRRIADSYEIMPTSRMAYSILKKSNAMRQDWAQDEANFMRHIEDQCGLDADREAMQQRLLEIYAAPIFNRQIK